MQMVPSLQVFCSNLVASVSNSSDLQFSVAHQKSVLPAQDAGRTLSQMGYVVEECKGIFLEQGCTLRE